jgi:acetyl-CoA C-acetyltransferase
MSIDWTRIPVLVGAAQLTNRDEDPLSAPDPFTSMERVATDASSPLGAGALRDLTHLWMVHSMSVRHPDPAAFLASRLGAGSAEARCSGMGGNMPQWLVDRACDLVSEGGRPRVLIVGAEALATRRRAKRAGIKLEWPTEPGWPETWPPLEPDLGIHEVESSHGLSQATAMYALIESAIAHRRGEGPEEHRRAMGRLMEAFNAVAVENPMSWFPTPRDGEELTTVTQENRMIYFPYPKYLNAVMTVDMAAAVVLTDAATARESGLGPDDVVYVSGWADAHEIWYVSQRPEVARAEALAACGRAAAEMAGVSLGEVSAFDLYSCFPSSIEVACDSFGIEQGDPRPITLTGGLPYHGGPGSNYVTHSIANTFDWLRAGEGHTVLVHGNGYYLTKHAVGIYSRAEPRNGPAPGKEVQSSLDATPLTVEAHPEGSATVVAYTAEFSREGEPEPASVLLEVEGVRTVARADGELTSALVGSDLVGTKVSVAASGEANHATTL